MQAQMDMKTRAIESHTASHGKHHTVSTQGHHDTTSGDSDGYQLLTMKNLQSIKSLFNVAHCLGDELRGNWLRVLETFEVLHAIIHLCDSIRGAIAARPQLTATYACLLPDESGV
jgi:hypothetical protein